MGFFIIVNIASLLAGPGLVWQRSVAQIDAIGVT